MNIEVEIKVKIDNFEEIKEKVSKIGKLVKSINQIDDYYIPCHRDFFAKKPHPTEWLRIRTNPDKIIWEYTRSINPKEDGDYDHAEEYETEISNVEELKNVFQSLPFERNKPNLVISHTIKGRGVKFLEKNYSWHHKSKVEEQEIIALYRGLEECE